VGDQHGRGAGGPQHTAHVLAQVGAEGGVEGRERLVQQHHRGPGSQRPGEGDPLLLAARELTGSASPGAGQADQLEALRHPRTPLGPREVSEPERHVAADVQVGEERTFLGHEADVAVLGGNPHPGPEHRPTTQHHRAGIGAEETGDRPQQRRLAATRRAEQRHDLTGLDPQVDPLEHLDRPVEGEADPRELQRGRRGLGRRPEVGTLSVTCRGFGHGPHSLTRSPARPS
jgi:hypothetical protein